MFLGIICYKTWLATFFITKFLSGRTEGRQGIVRSIIIPCGSYQLHLHHWFLVLIAGSILLAEGFYVLTPEVFYACLSAVVFQGVYCYEDWYQIVRRESVMLAEED
ncbi:MAG: hypothetical protein ACLFVA_01240 [Dehalococcoidia bacterium]